MFGQPPNDEMKSSAVQLIEGLLHAAVFLLIPLYTWGLNFVPLLSYSILLILSQG